MFATISSSLLFIVGPLLGTRVYFPDHTSVLFTLKHYVGPLALGLTAAAIARPVWTISGNPGQKSSGVAVPTSLLDLAAFSLILFVHFNLKLWSHLVNQENYDAEFQRIDNALAPVRGWLVATAQWVTPMIPLDKPYTDLFISMFLLSFLVHGASGQNRQLRVLLISTSLVLVLGGLAYWIAPAYGPMVFDMPDVEFVRYMLAFSNKFVASGGSEYTPFMFISMLAAMPSLHVANAVVLVYYAWKWRPALLWFHVPCTVYFLCQGVALRLHYLIDYPAGLILAGICVKIAELSIEAEERI